MKGLTIGLFLTVITITFSLEGSLELYLQLHSIIIVFFGTLAVFFSSTPLKMIRSLVTHIFEMLKSDQSFEEYEEDLASLSKNRFHECQKKHHLISYAQKLWKQGLDPDLFEELLSERFSEASSRTIHSVQILKNLAKYPPALGMMGTVMGMVSLFANLDSNRNAIGANLAMAMTATFFGLLLSNIILSPLADRLQIYHVNKKNMSLKITNIILLLNRNEPSVIIKDKIQDEAS